MDDFDRIEEQLLRDPDVRRELEARRPQFELASKMIGLRAAAGLTQRALADRVGMTQPEIARLESGQVAPTWATLSRILMALHADVDVSLPNTSGETVHLKLLAP